MIGFNLMLLTMLSHHYSKIEINDIINQSNSDIIYRSKIIPIERIDSNIIFLYRLNYKLNDEEFTFCSLPVVKGWAYKNGESTMFYLVLKMNKLLKSITKVYGEPENEIEVQINNQNSNSISYMWELKKLNILITNLRTFEPDPKLENCALVIIGNMKYNEIVNFL
jgi:hypothetical protein